MEVLTTDAAEVVEDLELLDGDLALVQGSAERVVRVRRHDQRSDDERGADGERHAACDELRAIQDLDLPDRNGPGIGNGGAIS